ncbi:hypothetical protein BGX33_004893 [Mortierella sp. NVP41]|nr:hypothetical protein BGX33_004893 [Mortierella sp. NVP41]
MLLSRLSAANLPKALSTALPIDLTVAKAASSPLDYLAHVRHLNLQHFSNRVALLHTYYDSILQQETVWCLGYPILEQLQSLVIPHMSSIKRYFDVVDRFEYLQHVQFLMSEMYEDPFDEDNKVKGAHNEEVIRDMVRFVQEHTRIFKGRLKSVDCLEGRLWASTDQEYTDRIRLALYRMLPPLSKPTHLGRSNWLQYTAHLDSIDLGHVWKVSSEGLPASWAHTVCNDQPLLQWCRTLKELNVSTLHDGAFKWAVQEKREMESLGGTTEGKGHGGQERLTWTETPQLAHRYHGLIPLEHAIITELSVSSSADIDDIVFAFNQTLKDLDVCVSIPFDRPRSFHFGQGRVDLPALTILELKLTFLDITVYRMEDDRADEDWSCIPPVEELNQSFGRQSEPGVALTAAAAVDSTPLLIRPQWTWDWHLPLLETLVLSSEFAYGFKFRMLHGCSALRILVLDIRSTIEGEHTRVLSESDLLAPSSVSLSDLSESTLPSSSPTPSERLCLPTLTHLELNGDWVIDDTLMRQFLAESLPGVKELLLKGWNLTTFEALVKLFRTMPAKYNESTCLTIWGLLQQDMTRLGIYEYLTDEIPVLDVRIENEEGTNYALAKSLP